MKYFDAHLDQYGPQSGGWGSPEQLQRMDRLSGALRVLFCEVDEEYPSTVDEHIKAADHIRTQLLPQNTPASWKLGTDYWLHVEGLESPQTEADVRSLMDLFHRWGVRGTTPIYHPDNPIGGCSKESGRGITHLGWYLIGQIWRRGWWLDLAHMSEQSMVEVLKRWKPSIRQKLAYTHGGICHGGIDHPALTGSKIERCISMVQAIEIVQRGGLVCLSPCKPFYPGFDGVFMEHLRALGEASNWRGVGIGTDFGGILDEWRFDGCLTIADCFAQLDAALYDEGFTNKQIDAIVGGNARRFFLG